MRQRQRGGGGGALTSCTFSGLFMLEPRRAPPLVPLPSVAEAAENRLSSSEISISGALTKTFNVISEVLYEQNRTYPHTHPPGERGVRENKIKHNKRENYRSKSTKSTREYSITFRKRGSKRKLCNKR